MKKSIAIVAGLGILASCNPTQPSTLEELKTQRDSLVTVRTEVTAEIKALDLEIALQDTAVKYTSVTALTVEPQSFDHYFDVFGTVKADQSIDLYPLASGNVKTIYVKKGQKVRKGQVLVVLDQGVLDASIAELNTALELAKSVYEKQRTLWLDNQIGSEVQYLQAKNNYDGLVRKLATMMEQKDLGEITAPFDGTIDEVFAKKGTLAAPQMPAVRLVNLSGVYVNADVPENYVRSVTVGTPANISFSSIDFEVASEVLQVGQFIDGANRSFNINVALPVSDMQYKPNQMVHVSLNDYHVDSAIVVPTRLIQQDATGQDFVFVVEQDENGFQVIVRKDVVTGMSFDGATELLSGLAADEQLVNQGSRSVRRGQFVTVK